jgi:hypothetical protein
MYPRLLSPRSSLACAAFALALLLPLQAGALSIDVSFTSSTYATQAGDDYASLLA